MKKLILLVLTLTALFAFVGCSGNDLSELSLEDGYVVLLTGADGEGHLEYVNPDTFKLTEAYFELRDIDLTSSSYDAETITELEAFDSFLHSLSFTPKGDVNNLSNGDEIEFSVNYDKEKAKVAKIKVLESDVTYEVEGLAGDSNLATGTETEEPSSDETEEVSNFGEAVSLLDYVTVNFSGVSPYVTAEYDASTIPGEYRGLYEISLTSAGEENRIDGKLENGEEVKLFIKSLGSDDEGRSVLAEEKSFIVEGEGVYPTTLTKDQETFITSLFDYVIQGKIQNDVNKKDVRYPNKLGAVDPTEITTHSFEIEKVESYFGYAPASINVNTLGTIYKVNVHGTYDVDKVQLVGAKGEVKAGEEINDTFYIHVLSDSFYLTNDGELYDIENFSFEVKDPRDTQADTTTYLLSQMPFDAVVTPIK